MLGPVHIVAMAHAVKRDAETVEEKDAPCLMAAMTITAVWNRVKIICELFPTYLLHNSPTEQWSDQSILLSVIVHVHLRGKNEAIAITSEVIATGKVKRRTAEVLSLNLRGTFEVMICFRRFFLNFLVYNFIIGCRGLFSMYLYIMRWGICKVLNRNSWLEVFLTGEELRR